MENDKPSQKKTKRKLNYQRIIPVILGLLILIVCIWGVIRLIIWNQGEEYIIDEGIDVDTETEDLVFFMSPAQTNPSYDGNFDVLILGNDTVTYDKDGSSIAQLLEEQIDGTIYNCSFEGSYMANQYNAEVIEEHPLDAFSFFWISDSIQNKSFKKQEEALVQLPDTYNKETYQQTLELLKTIDFNSIDLLLIYYDGHDYLAKNPIANSADIYDPKTMEGAFTGSFERYPRNYPGMQAMLIAPTFCYVIDENGNKEGCDIANLGHGNLPTCLTTLQIQAGVYGVSYLDNYYGIDIHADTAENYLLEDGITPNAEGRQMIADRIAKYVNARL